MLFYCVPQSGRERHVVRFVCGRGVAAVGDQLLLFTVPLLVYRATGSASKSGLAFLIEWLPRVLFLPVAGVLADRLGGYVMYLTADGARAAGTVLAFVSIHLWPRDQFLILSLTAAAMALASAQAYVAMESTLPQFVARERMVQAQSVLQATEQVSQIVGPALAALLCTIMPTAALLLVAGGVFALTTANVFLLRGRLRMAVRGCVGTSAVRSIISGVGQGARVLRRLPALLALIGLTMSVNLMVGVGMSTSAAMTGGLFGMPDRSFGLLSSSAGAIALLSFFLAPRLAARIDPVTAILASYALICLGGLGIGLAPTFPQFVLSYGVLTGTCGIFNVFIRTERIRRIPSRHRGKTIGLIILLNQLTLPVAGLVVAASADLISPQTVMRASVLASFVVAAVLLPAVKRLRYPVANPDLASNPV